jgi:osmoprotectant transport system permease protein
MGVLQELWGWLADPTNWRGVEGIPNRVFEHVQISLYATCAAALVAIPVGLYIGHARRFEFTVVSVGNIGRALPSFGVLALVFPLTFHLPGEIGFWPTLIALFVLAIPPILTNTYTGIKGVDRDVVEAARGMGLTGGGILRTIELPLARPLIVAGLRTAAVQVVATATLGAVVGWGGLGRFIIDGFAVRDEGQILGGALLVALLAVATEVALALLERATAPRGATRAPELEVVPAGSAWGFRAPL